MKQLAPECDGGIRLKNVAERKAVIIWRGSIAGHFTWYHHHFGGADFADE